MTIPVAHPTAGSATEAGRIDAIDVLRGFALLGILVLNVQSFAMPGAAYFNPTAYDDLEGANLHVWVAGRMLADQKFMTIFSMLFGAGIVLMTGRAEARGGARQVHYRRMAWLLVIGLLHAHLLWAPQSHRGLRGRKSPDRHFRVAHRSSIALASSSGVGGWSMSVPCV